MHDEQEHAAARLPDRIPDAQESYASVAAAAANEPERTQPARQQQSAPPQAQAEKTPTAQQQEPEKPAPTQHAAASQAPAAVTNWNEVEIEVTRSQNKGVPMARYKHGDRTVGLTMLINVNANRQGSEPLLVYRTSGHIAYNKELQGLVLAGGGNISHSSVRNSAGEPIINERTGKPLREVVISFPRTQVENVVQKLNAYAAPDGRAKKFVEAIRHLENMQKA
ncbi:MAG: hypothetical protein N3A02_03460 [Rectinema sp.]|nr:hypothetical protein [Rectinema sp.]